MNPSKTLSMADHEISDAQEILSDTAVRSFPAQEIWLLQNDTTNEVRLDLAWSEGCESWTVPAAWQGLLLVERVELRVTGGELKMRRLKLEVLSKLLAFIDEAQNIDERDIESSPWLHVHQDDLSVWQDRQHAEAWFLLQMLKPGPEFRALLTWLRHSESYWLVRFLLEQSASCSTLQDLGERYGVSYSHFRRLCRQALGSAAKTELRDWRIARSMLDVVEGQQNLTEVALKHGYASSSHFSNEIRERFGVSPRGLSNIIQLAAK